MQSSLRCNVVLSIDKQLALVGRVQLHSVTRCPNSRKHYNLYASFLELPISRLGDFDWQTSVQSVLVKVRRSWIEKQSCLKTRFPQPSLVSSNVTTVIIREQGRMSRPCGSHVSNICVESTVHLYIALLLHKCYQC